MRQMVIDYVPAVECADDVLHVDYIGNIVREVHGGC
jgi:hypothetical protein